MVEFLVLQFEQTLVASVVFRFILTFTINEIGDSRYFLVHTVPRRMQKEKSMSSKYDHIYISPLQIKDLNRKGSKLKLSLL